MKDLKFSRAALAACALAACAGPAAADIPDSERAVLDALYTSTNGPGWVYRKGWGGPRGTECGWHGITCDASASHVTRIAVHSNNLTGTLPDLTGLPALQRFMADDNQLSGAIPPLASLPALQWFWVNNNRLGGVIPPLEGMSALVTFAVARNQLTGPIPSLAGLPRLRAFIVANNRLSGVPPAAPASLLMGQALLCPNALHAPSSSDSAWDLAVGGKWVDGCDPALDAANR